MEKIVNCEHYTIQAIIKFVMDNEKLFKENVCKGCICETNNKCGIVWRE